MKKKSLSLTDAQIKILIDSLLAYRKPLVDGLTFHPDYKVALRKFKDADALGVYLLGVLQENQEK